MPGLEPGDIVNERTGIIMGSGGPSTRAIVRAADIDAREGPEEGRARSRCPRACARARPRALATAFQIKGINYSISSACATSAHCIGNAAEMIQWGKQDVMFAGGCEELDWTLSVLFDAMGAMSTQLQRHPGQGEPRLRQEPRRLRHRRRRRRGGAGGAASAPRRAAPRSTASSSATAPPPTASTWWRPRARAPCVACAWRWQGLDGKGVGKIDYINPHGTGTPVGDQREIEAIREVFGKDMPPISATKSLTGHSLGAVGVQEAIFSLLMMNNGFICESANIDELDPEFADVPIVRERQDNVDLNCVMSNSFGFGGTNATLVLKRCDA